MALTPKNQLIFSITAVAKKLKTRNTETLRRAAPTHIFIEKSTSATKVVSIVTGESFSSCPLQWIFGSKNDQKRYNASFTDQIDDSPEILFICRRGCCCC